MQFSKEVEGMDERACAQVLRCASVPGSDQTALAGLVLGRERRHKLHLVKAWKVHSQLIPWSLAQGTHYEVFGLCHRWLAPNQATKQPGVNRCCLS